MPSFKFLILQNGLKFCRHRRWPAAFESGDNFKTIATRCSTLVSGSPQVVCAYLRWAFGCEVAANLRLVGRVQVCECSRVIFVCEAESSGSLFVRFVSALRFALTLCLSTQCLGCWA